MQIVYLGIGTNLDDRERNLREAVARIEEFIGRVVMSSSVYETEPWGFKAENEFLNQVLKVETKLTPSGLLGRILMIESLLGRVRDNRRYASRLIDIDILLYGYKIINEISLKIPHPLLYARKFVLIPLNELDPGLVHPVYNQTIACLLEKCKDKSNVKKFLQRGL
jgi:2-amino-4-hydroxy-6-hydroxymethyldihydropteridine diphosphokinase